MGKCGKEPASPLEEEQSAPRSLSSLLDVRGFRSDVVVLLGSDVLSSGKQRLRFMAGVLVVALATHDLSACAWEYRGLRVFSVSYDGEDVEKGQLEQVHAWSSSRSQEQNNRQRLLILLHYFAIKRRATASHKPLFYLFKYFY